MLSKKEFICFLLDSFRDGLGSFGTKGKYGGVYFEGDLEDVTQGEDLGELLGVSQEKLGISQDKLEVSQNKLGISQDRSINRKLTDRELHMKLGLLSNSLVSCFVNDSSAYEFGSLYVKRGLCHRSKKALQDSIDGGVGLPAGVVAEGLGLLRGGSSVDWIKKCFSILEKEGNRQDSTTIVESCENSGNPYGDNAEILEALNRLIVDAKEIGIGFLSDIEKIAPKAGSISAAGVGNQAVYLKHFNIYLLLLKLLAVYEEFFYRELILNTENADSFEIFIKERSKSFNKG